MWLSLLSLTPSLFTIALAANTAAACEGVFENAAIEFINQKPNFEALNEFQVAVDANNLKTAFDILTRILGKIEESQDKEHLYNTAILPHYIELADHLKKHDLADQRAKQLLKIYAANCKKTDEFWIEWLLTDALERRDVGNPDFIAGIYRMAIESLELGDPSSHRILGQTKYSFGHFLLEQGKPDEAFDVHSSMLDVLEEDIGSGDERFGGTIFGLGEAYLKMVI